MISFQVLWAEVRNQQKPKELTVLNVDIFIQKRQVPSEIACDYNT